MSSPDTPGLSGRAVDFLVALADETDRRLIEELLDGRPRAKRGVLVSLGAPHFGKVPDQVYRRFNRLMNTRVLRVEGESVWLHVPSHLRAVIAAAARAGVASLRDELEQHESVLVAHDRELAKEPEAVFSDAEGWRIAAPALDMTFLPPDEPPQVAWGLYPSAERSGEVKHFAAMYSHRRFEITINDEWPPFRELLERLTDQLGAQGAERFVVRQVLEQEWERTLVSVVLEGRRYALEHGRDVEERLTPAALTTAVFGNPTIEERVRRRYPQELKRRREGRPR